MLQDTLGLRMKEYYEDRSRIYLTRKVPVIIRVDGKAFHTFTSGLRKPFDDTFVRAMQETMIALCESIQGCKLGFVQSDEISLLLTDYDTPKTEAWFGYNVQKMTSITASIATLAFNRAFANEVDRFARENIHYKNFEQSMVDDGKITQEMLDKFIKDRKYLETLRARIKKGAFFDARAFSIPKEEVCNYFIWRQQDATRNAINSIGFANFPTKSLYKLDTNQVQEKLFQEKGINFNDYPVELKRGSCATRQCYMKGEAVRSRWEVNKSIPIFTQDRDYIDQFVFLTYKKDIKA